MDSVPLRLTIAELTAYGIVGTILDGAYEVLVEIDPLMSLDLEAVMDQVMDKFKLAEFRLMSTEGLFDE